MIQRRELRDSSQHATRLAEHLQTAMTDEEANCEPGNEFY
jgi:hypothetical protein